MLLLSDHLSGNSSPHRTHAPHTLPSYVDSAGKVNHKSHKNRVDGSSEKRPACVRQAEENTIKGVPAVMFGWTILLIWADRKPLERKGVLILTAFPVVSGLLLAEFYAVIRGIISFERMLPTGVFLVGLIILFSFSYFNAKSVVDEG